MSEEIKPIPPEAKESEKALFHVEKQHGPITLLSEFSTASAEQIRSGIAERVPRAEKVFVLDFPIKNGDDSTELRDTNGKLLGRNHPNENLINLDHHLDSPEMWSRISAVDMVTGYVAEHGEQPEARIILHHTDPDSVCSAVLLLGAESVLGEEIVAKYPNLAEDLRLAGNSADHTGEENKIADLLGAIEVKRDLSYSIGELQNLLAGKPLDPEAEKLVAKRLQAREDAKHFVESGKLVDVGDGVMFAEFDGPIRAEFFPALLPEATAFILSSPMEGKPGFHVIKTRLGMGASTGTALNKLDLPQTGGRWNATSTKRDGGYKGNPLDYAAMVGKKMTSDNNPIT